MNNEKYGGESTNAKSENSEGVTVASSPSNLKTNANISSTNVSPKVRKWRILENATIVSLTTV